MAAPGVSPEHKTGVDLRVSEQDLTKLADDLDDIQDHLDQQVRRMDAIVDNIEASWQGPASSVYRGFHRAAAEDAVRIREVIKLLEEAVRLSRDGFTERELDVVDAMRRIEVDVASEVDRLSTPNTEPSVSAPRSRLDDF
ncbi:WXG100 family type VII secretion target [Streptomyces sp. NPDC017230]|uniref:WXG100 family type VII secretion target n=1 Tax=unclassified Streptomyces TaxID=2593676 RepID=UPI0037A2E392